MNKTHTPTPWNLGNRRSIYSVYGEENRTIAKSNNLNTEFQALSIGVPENQVAIIPLDESSEANAQFIVTACNAHDELVEALKAFINIAGHRWRSLPVDTPEKVLLNTAQQALSKAGTL